MIGHMKKLIKLQVSEDACDFALHGRVGGPIIVQNTRGSWTKILPKRQTKPWEIYFCTRSVHSGPARKSTKNVCAFNTQESTTLSKNEHLRTGFLEIRFFGPGPLNHIFWPRAPMLIKKPFRTSRGHVWMHLQCVLHRSCMLKWQETLHNRQYPHSFYFVIISGSSFASPSGTHMFENTPKHNILCKNTNYQKWVCLVAKSELTSHQNAALYESPANAHRMQNPRNVWN